MGGLSLGVVLSRMLKWQKFTWTENTRTSGWLQERCENGASWWKFSGPSRLRDGTVALAATLGNRFACAAAQCSRTIRPHLLPVNGTGTRQRRPVCGTGTRHVYGTERWQFLHFQESHSNGVEPVPFFCGFLKGFNPQSLVPLVTEV